MPDKTYLFNVLLSGVGADPDEAWENAVEALSLDPGECPDYEIEGEETTPPNPHAPYMSDAEYARELVCPACKSNNTPGDEVEFAGDGATWRPTRCDECGATWNEIGKVIGYTDMEVPHAEQS